MVFRTIGIHVITSTFFLRFLLFFKIQKVVTFYVFCRVSYVFSNYGCVHWALFASWQHLWSASRRLLVAQWCRLSMFGLSLHLLWYYYLSTRPVPAVPRYFDKRFRLIGHLKLTFSAICPGKLISVCPSGLRVNLIDGDCGSLYPWACTRLTNSIITLPFGFADFFELSRSILRNQQQWSGHTSIGCIYPFAGRTLHCLSAGHKPDELSSWN